MAGTRRTASLVAKVVVEVVALVTSEAPDAEASEAPDVAPDAEASEALTKIALRMC